MNKEIKDYADRGEVKRLKYIFSDCLDVDPTFEKYKDDYEYCKSKGNIFENHQELTPFQSEKNQWNKEYWIQLKMDLVSNFSEERLLHMVEVAQVVYKEKIIQLKERRNLIKQRKNDEKGKKEKTSIHLQEKDQDNRLNIDKNQITQQNINLQTGQVKQEKVISYSNKCGNTVQCTTANQDKLCKILKQYEWKNVGADRRENEIIFYYISKDKVYFKIENCKHRAGKTYIEKVKLYKKIEKCNVKLDVKYKDGFPLKTKILGSKDNEYYQYCYGFNNLYYKKFGEK